MSQTLGTVWDCYLFAKQRLKQAGCDSPAFRSRCLCEHFLHAPDPICAGQQPVTEADAAAFRAAVARQENGYPLQYVLGEWEFMGLRFFVGEGVLIPRPDTELLCETGIAAARQLQKPRVLELCAGSGAVAIALAAHCPDAQVTALELSPDALRYLRRNNALHGGRVTVVERDMLLPPTEEFDRLDLLLANPPYIDDAQMALLPREVRFEPTLALSGGADGLCFYRAIATRWLPKLRPGGVAAVEIGEEQGAAVAALFSGAGLSDVMVLQDLSGHDRVVRGVVRTPAETEARASRSL